MAVRTYYGDERVTVPGPDDTRLAGTVSGVAGGRVVVALDEESELYPVGYGEEGVIPGKIAQVQETDLEFFIDGSDSATPSFSPAQLAYLRRTYGDSIAAAADSEERASYVPAEATFEPNEDDDGIEEAAAAAAKQAAAAAGAGLSKAELANAKNAGGS